MKILNILVLILIEADVVVKLNDIFQQKKNVVGLRFLIFCEYGQSLLLTFKTVLVKG